MIKAVLFWVYLWQLKGYRLDRFWAEFGQPKKILKFWFFSGGRKFWKPVRTIKAILITLASLFIAISLLFSAVSRPVFILHCLLIYFLAPIVVAGAVFIFQIPTGFIKQLIFRQASRKIDSTKNLTVIGVTGSYGKSSTKEFIAQILARKFKVSKTPLNVNTEVGVAEFILKELPKDTQIFVVEMGAYKKGEIKRTSKIVKPKIGILTGISPQHLALFGSLENIKQAKFELIESLPPEGLAVFNGENKYTLELAQKWPGKKVIYCNHISFGDGSMPRHYRLNLNAAVEVAGYLGMTEGEIKEAVENIKREDNFIKSFVGLNGAWVINDTYSANPDGVLAALDYLAIQSQSTKIVVMPCLIELGEAASKVHQAIGRKIKEVCDWAIITTSAYFEDIKKEAGDKAILMENSSQVREFLRQKLNSGWVVLLEGRIAPDIIKGVKK